MDDSNDDFDTRWKTAIARYFQEFLAFYFPTACAAIDWAVAPAFLDQDLAPLVPDARTGCLRLDKLARIARLDGLRELLACQLATRSGPQSEAVRERLMGGTEEELRR
ncbi:hypothetical protein [Pseudoduganella sp. RAF53_2]|uniref:hypothetical protein n=1 Tax=unclassified Pseudoduganella TaxID=2637179 RepID=UPI003F9BD406